MKLRRRNKPEHQTTAPWAGTTPAGLPVLLTISTDTNLPEPDFKAQAEKLRHVACYDNVTSSWNNQIPLDRPEWAAEALSTLFEAARAHGTRVEVQAEPPARNCSSVGPPFCLTAP
jgi:hypothetical protein